MPVWACRSGLEHRDREYHRQMNLLLTRLDEQQRRWYLAVESQRLGHGADRLLFEITGVDEKTIRRGREELAASLVEQPTDRHPSARWWPTARREKKRQPSWQRLKR